MSLLSILATISGIMMSFGNFFQAHRIFKRKSAKDVSIATYSMFLIGTTIWVLYGFEIMNWTIILPNITGIIAVSSVIIGWWRYK